MTHRMTATALLLALCALAAPAAAEDLAAEAKRQVQMFDDTFSKAKDDVKWAEFVMDLTSCPHPVVVERIARILMKDPSLDRKIIAVNALAEFRKPADAREAAGNALTKSLGEKDIDFDVKEHAVGALGTLKYREAIPVLNEIVLDKNKSEDSAWFVLATIRAMAAIGDRRALSALLELWERMPSRVVWHGGEVKVDTGSAGDRDQKAAEAKYKEKYGNGRKRGKPPTDFRAWAQEMGKTIAVLTGEQLGAPEDLRAWMEARAAELKKEGVVIPEAKDDKKKDEKGKGDKGKDEKSDPPKDEKK
ncbi:MAG: hypothetical protein HMLKMBBP_02708 [Planctomycetes bacterium]|nr:hypothetical protein [Planctomycetota bacterium]